MGDTLDVQPGDLKKAAHAYHEQEQRTKADSAQFSGAAKLDPDVWGNLPESYKWANQYDAFYHQVIEDVTKIGKGLHSFATMLNASARAYTKTDHANRTVIVKSGDTLWGIAQKKLGDGARWPEIAKHNPQIKDPNLIHPGDKITIPKDAHQGGHGHHGAKEYTSGSFHQPSEYDKPSPPQAHKPTP